MTHDTVQPEHTGPAGRIRDALWDLGWGQLMGREPPGPPGSEHLHNKGGPWVNQNLQQSMIQCDGIENWTQSLGSVRDHSSQILACKKIKIIQGFLSSI